MNEFFSPFLDQAAPHRQSLERLSHFQCGACRGWWSIGDAFPFGGAQACPEPVEVDRPEPVEAAPENRTWHCPWCGHYACLEPRRKARTTDLPNLKEDRPNG